MSCFIVSDRQLNDTINFIRLKSKSDLMHLLSYKTRQEVQEKFMMSSELEKLQFIGQRILNANNKSWVSRYDEKTRELYEEKDFFEYKSNYQAISITQFLKNLACIEYQCCEIDNYYTDDTSIHFDIQELRKFGINLLDGYEQAQYAYN